MKKIDNKDIIKFLQEEHALHYGGLDDDMPDDFNEWLSELDEIAWVSIMVRHASKLQHELKGEIENMKIEVNENMQSVAEVIKLAIVKHLDKDIK